MADMGAVYEQLVHAREHTADLSLSRGNRSEPSWKVPADEPRRPPRAAKSSGISNLRSAASRPREAPHDVENVVERGDPADMSLPPGTSRDGEFAFMGDEYRTARYHECGTVTPLAMRWPPESSTGPRRLRWRGVVFRSQQDKKSAAQTS